VAYVSNETGRAEVFVQAARGGGGKWMVSTQGGGFPRWRGDSRELYFFAADKIVAVDATSKGAVFVPGPPQVLFGTPLVGAGAGHSDFFLYAPARDGSRFLIGRRPGGAPEGAPLPIVVVLN